MISILEHTFIITSIFLLNIELCICACARAEYEINGECCPMCSAGNRVYRHCTEFTSTTCLPCVGSTYTDEPNGLPRCITCTVCDSGQGLRVKTACTRTSDTDCEPLEGFYCTDENRDSCRYALEHTKCSPGQYIKQKGTAVKDAECAVCADGTYSNGSLEICKPHTKCEDLGLKEITPGTNTFDVECGRKTPVHLIAGLIVAVAVVAGAGVIAFLIKHKKIPPTACTGEKPRFSTNETCERDTSSPLTMEERRHRSGQNIFPPTLNILSTGAEEAGVSAVLTYGASCRKSEYRSTAGECCPMCSAGMVVMKDCIGDYSTSCKPCSKGTFMNEPNGLPNCFPCKTCDTGLFILQDCTLIKNTVCEVRDGYYCSQYSDGGCALAVKHSECQPGQHIKKLGTKASDTVCEPCPSGFYSPEGVNCTKWTDCLVRNEIEDQEGTSIRDVQCKASRKRYGLIPAFVLYLPTVIFVFILCFKNNSSTELKSPVMETNPEVLDCAASSSKQEENEEVDQPAAR